MELRQLEYFVAVTEEANFTRAAARLHVAQPGVSAQIRRLEAELGQTLLDRSARAVRLTEVGAEVLPYAQAALNAVANCRLVVDELTGLIRGHVSVGMITSLPFDLPSLLAGFHDDHPAVELTLSEATSGNLLDALRAGQLDLAWIGSVVSPSAGIETQIVEEQPLVAAVAHPDSWAAKASVALRELEGRPLISLPLGTGLRTRFDEACVLGGVRAQSLSRPVTSRYSVSSRPEVSVSESCLSRTPTPIPSCSTPSPSPILPSGSRCNSPGEPKDRSAPQRVR